MIYTGCGLRLMLDPSGRVLIFSRITDILHKRRIYRCTCLIVLIFRHAPAYGILAHLPGCLSCLSCPGVVTEFQSAQIKRLSYANICACERVERHQSHANHARHINTLIDIIKAIICLHFQIVKVRKYGSILPIKIFCIFQLLKSYFRLY